MITEKRGSEEEKRGDTTHPSLAWKLEEGAGEDKVPGFPWSLWEQPALPIPFCLLILIFGLLTTRIVRKQMFALLSC